MAERSKARQVEYYDPDGNVQSGWYKDHPSIYLRI